MLQRMRELSVQAANSTLSVTDASSVNSEMQQLKAEINRVAAATTFNGQYLLTGALGGNTIGAGGIVAGGALANGGDSGTITTVNGGAAQAGTYTVDASVAGKLTLKNGATALQTIDTGIDMTAGELRTYNFDQVGVSFSIVADATNPLTAVDLNTALDTQTVVVSAGTTAAANFQIGANAVDSLSVTFSDARTATYGTTAGAFDTALASFATAIGGTSSSAVISAAQGMITQVDAAISQVSTIRGGLGAVQNRLEHTISNLGVASENLTASESRIKDLDMAAEMVTFTKTQILSQAGTAILAQANQAPQGILSLLK
jgi:flagellin